MSLRLHLRNTLCAAALLAAASAPGARAAEPVTPFIFQADAASQQAPAGGAALDFTLTGTLDLTTDACGTDTSFSVPPGTDVRFCYTAHNTGTVTFDLHDLEDMDGVVFTDLPIALEPGFAMYLMQNRSPALPGSNVATWTATASASGAEATDSDSVQTRMADPILYCNGPTSTFSNGIPVGWTSMDHLALTSEVDSDVDWQSLADCGEAANYTGGRGGAACASSAAAGAQPYDTQLRSHSFTLSGVASARLEFLVNYQDAGAAGDLLSVDVSLDGGDTWSPLASSSDADYGALRALPGMAVSIDLASVVGELDLRLGWRYVDSSGGALDEYVQVDNVRLVCDDGLFYDGFESGDTDAWSGVGEI